MVSGKWRHLHWLASHYRARLLPRRTFAAQARKRVLIIAEATRIPQSQIYPFHFYKPELQAKWQHDLIEVEVSRFEQDPAWAPANADLVLVQTWFDLEPVRCNALFAKIRDRHPSAKIVYLDSFAPTDLRLAEMLDPHIDLYVKKHVFRDRSRYAQSTRGDTNLVDYYGKLYGMDYPDTHFSIPPGFLDKLVVGPSFCSGPMLLPVLHGRSRSLAMTPRLDVHARLAANGGGWYGAMRTEAIRGMDMLDDCRVASRNGIKQSLYMKELATARLCFSPFGYGEVCWRDYEAVFCGALLIKPDMSHIETMPDIFRPCETYVPVAWDFSDLQDVIRYWLARPDAARRMTDRAYQVLHEDAREARFVQQMERVFAD